MLGLPSITARLVALSRNGIGAWLLRLGVGITKLAVVTLTFLRNSIWIQIRTGLTFSESQVIHRLEKTSTRAGSSQAKPED